MFSLFLCAHLTTCDFTSNSWCSLAVGYFDDYQQLYILCFALGPNLALEVELVGVRLLGGDAVRGEHYRS